MTRRKASFLQGTEAAKYQLPAEDHRLNHAGLWIPSSVPGAAALAVQSGVVWGPGNPGAVSVVAGGVSINPFHAAVQGTRSGVQGVFELTSDAVEFRAVTAASSTEFRRGRLGVRIYDQLNGAAKDDWDLEVIYGAAAASAGAAQLPPLPADSTWFELRQALVDPAGAITLSGITPRTMPRGSILPVDAIDVTPGAYSGQYRDHPARGLERWDGADWGDPQPDPERDRLGLLLRAFQVQGSSPAIPTTDAVFTHWTSVPDYVRDVAMWDNALKGFKAPWTGRYRARVELTATNGPVTNVNLVCRLARNYVSGVPSGVITSDTQMVFGAGETSVNLDFEGSLVANDVVRVLTWIGAAGATWTPVRFGFIPYFTVTYLGPNP